MIVALHPIRWWDSCMSKDQKREIEPVFTDKDKYKVSSIVSTKINGEFFIKYKKFFELVEIHAGNVYFGGMKTFSP